MKALVLEAFNTPYQLKEVPQPAAAAGQVLVKIAASGINPLDLKIKAGQAGHAQAQLPAIPGMDMAGTVTAVGEGVTNFKPGDEVYGFVGGIAGVPGTLAEYVAADADLLALKPRNLSMQQAAAMPLAFITAWEGLIDRANISAGKTVLIHGGAGGVGHIAVQIAAAQGAKVYATVRPSANELMKSYGAIPVDYLQLTADAYVKQYTNGEGFDVILDTIGGKVLDDSFQSVKRYTGHVLSILGWSAHSLAPLSFRGASYSGVFTLYPLISGKARKHHGEIMQEATKLAEAGLLTPLLHTKVYNLHSIEDAHSIITQGKAEGKVVVNIEF